MQNNSKLNTILLGILIVLALIIIFIQYHNRKAEEVKDKATEITNVQSLAPEKLEEVSWVPLVNSYDMVKKCLGENTNMVILDAVKESIKKCPEIFSVSVSQDVQAVIKNNQSYNTEYFLLEFHLDGKRMEDIPSYQIPGNALVESVVRVSYFDEETIAVVQQCSYFEFCYDFLSFGTWMRPEAVMTSWLKDENRFKEFYSSFPIGNSNITFVTHGITKDGNYVFTEQEGACDECLGSLYFNDRNDNDRFLEKGSLNFVFDNNLEFIGFGYIKE